MPSSANLENPLSARALSLSPSFFLQRKHAPFRESPNELRSVVSENFFRRTATLPPPPPREFLSLCFTRFPPPSAISNLLAFLSIPPFSFSLFFFYAQPSLPSVPSFTRVPRFSSSTVSKTLSRVSSAPPSSPVSFRSVLAFTDSKYSLSLSHSRYPHRFSATAALSLFPARIVHPLLVRPLECLSFSFSFLPSTASCDFSSPCNFSLSLHLFRPFFVRLSPTCVSLHPSIRAFCPSSSTTVSPLAARDSTPLASRIFHPSSIRISHPDFHPFRSTRRAPLRSSNSAAIPCPLHLSRSTAKVNPVSSEGASSLPAPAWTAGRGNLATHA